MKKEIKNELLSIERSMHNLHFHDYKLKHEMQTQIRLLKKSLQKISDTIEYDEPKELNFNEDLKDNSFLFNQICKLKRENDTLKESIKLSQANPQFLTQTKNDRREMPHSSFDVSRYLSNQ